MTDDELMELASSAYRERDRRGGRVVPSAAWMDLDEAGRRWTLRACRGRLGRCWRGSSASGSRPSDELA